MVKRLLSFISLFVVTFCFVSGCKDNNNGDQAVLVDNNGKEVIATINGVNYTADYVYDSMLTSKDTVGYIYEQLEDLLIKTVVPVTESMKNRANNYVEKIKREAKENATINNKSYKDTLAESLKNEGAASEDELYSNKIFEYQEEIITSQYWNNNKDKYYSDYLNNSFVYHIGQIFVKIDKGTNKDAFDVEPTSTIAKKLYDVTSSLMNGESFYNVALRYSDDSTSKEKGGDLGLVTLNDTSIPDEVKYALANYSIYLENAELDGNDYFDEVYSEGIETIPQEYVDLLGEIYDNGSTNYITTITGTTSLTSRVYGRNVIFNNLYNSRTFRFLQSNGEKNVEIMDNIKMPLVTVAGFETKSAQNIVVNSEQNPILVVRSDSGIHFISIIKSAFEGAEELAKYYSKEVDYSDNYRTYLEKSIDESDKTSRLNKLEGLAKEYANMIISGNDSFKENNVDYVRFDMFKYYLDGTYNGVEFKIVDERVRNAILQYIDAEKANRKYKIEEVYTLGFEKHANAESLTNSSLFQKEIPILGCLKKDANDKYMCTYTYKEGFKTYTSVSGGGE